ncbi:MAG: hypothetical protein IPL61_38565 [Myxococcales bacterium]|nr:hypothetical protein [Myxococcales bacterium]
MPDGSGAGFVANLQRDRPDLARRIIVLTGGAVDAAARQLVADGVIECCSLPVEPELVLARVAAVAASATAPPRRLRTTALGQLLPNFEARAAPAPTIATAPAPVRDGRSPASTRPLRIAARAAPGTAPPRSAPPTWRLTSRRPADTSTPRWPASASRSSRSCAATTTRRSGSEALLRSDDPLLSTRHRRC